jgi:pyruvate carboxylase subunit B
VFKLKSILADNDEDFSIEHVRDGLYSILAGGRSISAVVDFTDPMHPVFTVGDRIVPLHLVDHRLQLLEEYGRQDARHSPGGQIRAPMPGLVLKVQVEPGSVVSRNDPLLVLEAMKMENEIRSPSNAIVSAVHVSAGQAVAMHAPLIELASVEQDS